MLCHNYFCHCHAHLMLNIWYGYLYNIQILISIILVPVDLRLMGWNLNTQAKVFISWFLYLIINHPFIFIAWICSKTYSLLLSWGLGLGFKPTRHYELPCLIRHWGIIFLLTKLQTSESSMTKINNFISYLLSSLNQSKLYLNACSIAWS